MTFVGREHLRGSRGMRLAQVLSFIGNQEMNLLQS